MARGRLDDDGVEASRGPAVVALGRVAGGPIVETGNSRLARALWRNRRHVNSVAFMDGLRSARESAATQSDGVGWLSFFLFVYGK